MTYDEGFNDGIEAAAQWMDELARQQATITGMAEDAHNSRTIAQNIRALKRPEPSEVEKVERMAAAIKKRAIETAQADESEDWFAEQFARAALKAMEGQ